MSKPSILDQLIVLLEDDQQTGVQYVEMSEEALDFLRDPGPKPEAKEPSAPQAYFADSEPAEEPPEQPAIQNAPPVAKPEPAAPAVAPASQEDKQPLPDLTTLDLNALEQVVAPCVRCKLCQQRTQTVFGEGHPNADLMFIGEGPGSDEDRTGRPFVGRAGRLLDDIIHAMQFRREDVYIANIVKCRPPGNRNPDDAEAAACLPYLQRQIELIQPRVIVTLGAVPLKHLLKKEGITRLHGAWLSFGGIKVMPTYHPSFVLRKPESKREVWEDMQKVMAFFGKDPRQSSRRQ